MQRSREGRDAAGALRQKVDDFVDQMRRGVQDELKELRQSGGTMLRLMNGQRVAVLGERFLYQFESDVPTSALPPETPVELHVRGGQSAQGTVVAAEEFLVLLELREDLGEVLPAADLTTKPWQILESLGKRLEGLRSDGSDELRSPIILPALLDLQAPAAIADSPKVASATLEANQREAVRRAATNSLHFVWGPPGTGKTRTLAETVRTLLAAGERVLVAAPSNVAVDVATLRTAALLEGTELVEEGRVLRVGTPHLPELRSREDLLPEAILCRRHPALFADLHRLREERRTLLEHIRPGRLDVEEHEQASRKLEDLNRRLSALHKQLELLVNELVSEARFLGVTLAKLTVDPLLWTQRVDTVIVDEVSMSPFAHLFAAASRAFRRVVLFGDPRQLPPIHLAQTEAARLWLGRDAFEVAGVSGRMDDPRVSFLPRQHRMAPAIAEVVSELAYDGRLQTAAEAERKATHLAGLPPLPGRSVVLVDTSDLRPRCVPESRLGSYSRVNPLHLAIATGLALALRREECESLAYISPYRAQVYVASRFQAPLQAHRFLRTATVHRFQGSETDAVILDLVDANPQKRASQLTGADANTALRLVNVAISRARGKLVILADASFIRKRHLPGSPSARLLQLVAEDAIVPASQVLCGAEEHLTWFESWEAARGALAADIRRIGAAFVGNLPPGFTPGPDLLDALNSPASHESLLCAPLEIASELEESALNVRLAFREFGFVFCVGPDLAWVGSDTPTRPVARLQARRAAEVLQDVLFGDEAHPLQVEAPQQVPRRRTRSPGQGDLPF